MKKVYIIPFIIVLLWLSILVIYLVEQKNYGLVDFAGISYIRKNDHAYETIKFAKDYSFSYYSELGNAIADYDLCDSYKYNKKEKIIYLNCIEDYELSPDTYQEIKVVLVENNLIKLQFGDEIREFERE